MSKKYDFGEYASAVAVSVPVGQYNTAVQLFHELGCSRKEASPPKRWYDEDTVVLYPVEGVKGSLISWNPLSEHGNADAIPFADRHIWEPLLKDEEPQEKSVKAQVEPLPQVQASTDELLRQKGDIMTQIGKLDIYLDPDTLKAKRNLRRRLQRGLTKLDKALEELS